MSIHDSKFNYCPRELENFYFFYDIDSINKDKPNRVIKEYFSTLYKSKVFLESIYNVLVNYESAAVEGCYWYYPDLSSRYPDDNFEGVCFEIGFNYPDMKVYVSEQVSFDYAKKACERFSKLHPEHRDFLASIIDNWKPF